MGIRIDGNNDLINAADGSLTVEGLSIDVTGIVTASGGYKVGSAYTVFSNGNVATAGVVTTTKLQVNSATNTAAEFKGAGGAGFIGIRDGDDSTLAFIGVDAGVLKFQTSGSSYSDKLTIATDGKATFTGITTVSGETLFAKQLSLTGVTTSSNKFHINSLGIGMVPIDHQHIHVEAANPRILIRSTGTNAAKIHFGDSGANDRGIIEYNHSSDNMRFGTAGTEDHLVIDSNGKILVNHTSARQVAGGNSLIQVESNDSTGRISIVQNRNEASGAPFLSLGKSRGTAVGGTTIVQDGDTVGTVAFAGSDGTDFPSVAQIIGQVDGTPGNNDMPGRLIFNTCPNDTDSATERLRIDSSGRIGIQGAATRALLEVRASGGNSTMLTAVFGANEGTTAGTLSDDTDKACRIGIPHYDSGGTTPFAFLVGSSGSSSNTLNFGGGTSLMNAATQIQFTTAANTTTTSGTTRMTIDSSGDVTFDPNAGGTLKIAGSSAHTSKIVIADNGGTGNGNCLVEGGDGTDFFTIQSSGNVAFTNGRGISFADTADGGNSATMSSELLDDYEEGTFTPSLSFGGGDTGMSYSSRSGSYIKIGSMCYIQGQLDLSSKGSSGGDAAFGNFPFQVGNYVSGTGQEGSGFITWWANFSSTNSETVFWINEGGTTASIYVAKPQTNIQTQTQADWNNNTQIRFFAQYRTV